MVLSKLANLFYFTIKRFGGETTSLAVDFAHAEQFRAAGYAPFLVDGTEYGEVRQYGNFSFLRIYECDHEVLLYQPEASLTMFNCTIFHFDVATGEHALTAELNTTGSPESTHTEAYAPLPSETTTQAAAKYGGSRSGKSRLAMLQG